MTLVLILIGAALVAVATFNKMPQFVPGRVVPPRVPSRQGAAATSERVEYPRVRIASARLTENGRALLTTIGGSALIIAFFLTLSGF
ncbi:hypothetical protein [Nocardiopsis kunsanensis]|uniref:Uncharacterized protein n=1 Tax=Nocardiopsis kunsanensis TaxID=141693 RepID=A0A919CGU6_9ACTN|nr:hypothetical protein [Nocardiopsis kunsanensis]GHD21070.1 hypothetical protein GCM10007147_14090 [Nocardiopsis kunsanensis]